MTVNLATDVALESTAPDPVSESRASEAPQLSDTPASAPDAVPDPAPAPVVAPAPAPVTPPPVVRPVQPQRPATRPAVRPQPPIPLPTSTPNTSRQTPPQSRPTSRPPSRPPSRPTTTRPPANPAAKPTSKPGGSRLGDDFLAGAGTSSTTTETRTPASQIGASAKASLVAAISREIKPHWQPPSGPEVEKITTYLRFRLNSDGSLSGRPSVVRQTGVNDTNCAQADRHAEQAIRAVQLAAPFDLPSEYYEAWKVVGPFGFDWRLAQ